MRIKNRSRIIFTGNGIADTSLSRRWSEALEPGQLPATRAAGRPSGEAAGQGFGGLQRDFSANGFWDVFNLAPRRSGL